MKWEAVYSPHTAPTLEAHHTRLAACRHLRTVGDLVQALTAAAAWRATRPVGATGGVAWEEWVRQHLDLETQLREQPALEGE